MSGATGLSVPGNLLLAGEYAVTEEGGIGFAAAIDRRAEISLSEAGGLSVEGRWLGETRLSFRYPDLGNTTLPYLITEHLIRTLSLPRRPEGSIVVDTSAFFRPDGSKRGYGSSAAVTCGIAASLTVLAGGEPDPGTLLPHAVDAHRHAQGGRGSGYDVACSLFGGTGLFTGGRAPSWTPAPAPWLASLILVQGGPSVHTPGAIAAYERWKATEPGSARRFVELNNAAVSRLAAAQTAAEASEALRLCGEIGLELGRSIGVSAEFSVPDPLSGCVGKAIGAGNELAVFIDPGEEVTVIEGAERLSAALEGVSWRR